MPRSLLDYRILLGAPLYRSAIGEDADGARVAAHWACGCIASGVAFERLTLKSCSTHRAERGVPVLA